MIFQKKHWVWAVDKPEDIEFQKFVGRHVRVADGGNDRMVEIQSLQGSLKYPNRFQVNTKVDGEDKSFFISMLDFYAQMNGESISKEDIKAFDETTFEMKQNPLRKQRGLWLPNRKPN